MKYKFIWIAVLAISIVSCHKDIDDDNAQSETTVKITTPIGFAEVDGTIIGYVYDENNEAVADANVSIYSAQTTTNGYGVFRLENTKMDPQGTLVNVSKNGFETNSDFIYPNDKGAGTSQVQLRKQSETGSINGSSGGTVEMNEDGHVKFSSNSISQLNGSLYSGEVSVNALTMGYDDANLNDIMPGSLVGFDENLGNRALSSLGAISISLTNAGDDKLKLISGKTFEVKYPISSNQLSDAPDEVEIWLLDEATGIWNLKGKAQKSGAFYIATVDQVGVWLFANSYYLSQFCARLVTDSGLPAKNFNYRVLIDNQICGQGISDADGFVCSKLPKGENLSIEIMHPFCNTEVINSADVGPLDDVENIGDIQVEVADDFRFGKIVCSEDNFPDATLIIKSNENTALLDPEADGTFNLNINSILCNSTGEYSVFAINNQDGTVSPVLNLSEGSTAEMRLDVCGSACEFEVKYELSRLDYCSSGDYDVATVIVIGGSGNYAYQWQDGGSGLSNSNIVTNSDLCVNVTDLASGCSLDFCGEIPLYERLQLDGVVASNTQCQQNSGEIDLELSGGVKPYAIEWNGPISLIEDLEHQEDLPPGEYSVLVRDANNCTVDALVKVYDITNNIESTTENLCDSKVITILEGEGYAPYQYEWNDGDANENVLTIYTPGTYIVTVSDQNGCTRSKSFEINEVGIDPVINTINSCNEGDAIFEVLDEGNGYFFIPEGSAQKENLIMINGIIYISVFESGYSYDLGMVENTLGCEKIIPITLPNFEGLSIESVQNTSCAGCEDGSINVLIDETADCTGGCVAGTYIVLAKDSGNDVTELNNGDGLSSGEYVVVVLDELSGCYIAHINVEVE